jgi:hypothetical protein
MLRAEVVMAEFGELLQAAAAEASLLVLFIPSADREGGRPRQKGAEALGQKGPQVAGR